MSKHKKNKTVKSKDGATSAATDAPGIGVSTPANAPVTSVPLAPNEGGETAPEPFSSDE